ncbi:family 24 glycoside hydrolase [Panaeolus papilionaceus]|nr:family 24 glycoside hydrolase [Panaeolus papilionaceus]
MFSTISLTSLAILALQALQVSACTGPSVNSATISAVKGFEGFVASPAPDPIGLPTVGYGHKCCNTGCAEVPSLLSSDLVQFQNCVTNAIASSVRLNANQYGALVSWTFNVGCANMQSSTLIRRLNSSEAPNTVAAQELPKWNWANGQVLPGLVTRRAAEVKLFQTSTSSGALPAC